MSTETRRPTVERIAPVSVLPPDGFSTTLVPPLADAPRAAKMVFRADRGAFEFVNEETGTRVTVPIEAALKAVDEAIRDAVAIVSGDGFAEIDITAPLYAGIVMRIADALSRFCQAGEVAPAEHSGDVFFMVALCPPKDSAEGIYRLATALAYMMTSYWMVGEWMYGGSQTTVRNLAGIASLIDSGRATVEGEVDDLEVVVKDGFVIVTGDLNDVPGGARAIEKIGGELKGVRHVIV